MVEQTVARARPERVAVSLPSLRLDSFSVELSEMVAEGRKSGITFAPEAASPRLRALINKWIPDEELPRHVGRGVRARVGPREAVLHDRPPDGARRRHPRDRRPVPRTLARGRNVNNARRSTSASARSCRSRSRRFNGPRRSRLEETERRQRVLGDALRSESAIKFGRHAPEETFLEGLISRADRRGGDLIEAAWRNGCRFDAWREHLDMDGWMKAVADVGYDVADALRERDPDERLPWDHIDVLIPKKWFQDDWKRANELKHAEDCRHKRCHKCGVIDVERELCASMLRENVEGRKTESRWIEDHRGEDGVVQATSAPRVEPAAVQRLWLRIGRTGGSRFLSHLEAMNAWFRALRRARTPLAYSQGFHPHPKIAFSAAVPCGEESVDDWFDVTLIERVDPIALADRLRAVVPDGFAVLGAREVPLNAPSLMGVVRGAVYTLDVPGDHAVLASKVADLMARDKIIVKRVGKTRGKKGQVAVDIRPMILDMQVLGGRVEVTLGFVDWKPGKPAEIAELLSDDPMAVRIIKQKTLLADPSEWANLPAAAVEDEEASV